MMTQANRFPGWWWQGRPVELSATPSPTVPSSVCIRSVCVCVYARVWALVWMRRVVCVCVRDDELPTSTGDGWFYVVRFVRRGLGDVGSRSVYISKRQATCYRCPKSGSMKSEIARVVPSLGKNPQTKTSWYRCGKRGLALFCTLSNGKWTRSRYHDLWILSPQLPKSL